MAKLLDNCSVIKEIGKVDEAIKNCFERVGILEQNLEDTTISPEKHGEIKRELVEMRKLLRSNQVLLSKLHGHNKKSFMVALFSAFICFALYMLFILVVGLDY